jgi:hypothetical protein
MIKEQYTDPSQLCADTEKAILKYCKEESRKMTLRDYLEPRYHIYELNGKMVVIKKDKSIKSLLRLMYIKLILMIKRSK